MTAPPTLADACIATALDKHFFGRGARSDFLRSQLLPVAKARKFVLDSTMSRFLADLSDNFWHGGLRKRVRMLDSARRLARLPHALTWIEFAYHGQYIERIRELKSQGVGDFSGRNPECMGWLLRQHPHNEAAFSCIEIRSSVRRPDRVFIHPVGAAWCADDNPSPWRRFPDAQTIASEAVTGMQGLHSMQAAHWFPFLGHALTVELLDAMTGSLEDNLEPTMVDVASKPAVALRAVWALLATINDLPIKIETIEPSRGYVARGSYKKFLQHSVIHLTVPETRWRQLVLKTHAVLRRRAHQVRGHWRRDWRNPLTRTCEHDFDEQMICRRCRGRQLWIQEHQRGDASIGFVTHDYEVHHEAVP